MKKIKFTTAGESHGELLQGILEGIPSNLEISESYIHNHLKRRLKGFGRGKRMQIEDDTPKISSGLRFGKTLGSPIGIIIKNNDWINWKNKMSIKKNHQKIKKITIPRPGHADLAGLLKYDFDDIRNVIERSSARETAMRVALGSICKKFLLESNIHIYSRVLSIGSIYDDSQINSNDYKNFNKIIDNSLLRCYSQSVEKKMIQLIDKCKEKGDSVGGQIEVISHGLPYGLGSYIQWDKKLSSIIGSLMLSINAFKSFTIGSLDEDLGSNYHDEILFNREKKYSRSTNRAGGIEGGMSNTKPIILKMHMKPIPTLRKPLKSVDIKTKESKSAHKERSDICALPAASIIAEHMLSFAIAETLLDKFGGDSIKQFKAHLKATGKF